MNDDTSYRGHLLVAAPELLDPNFHQTVVLIVEHGEQGTLGLVLTRPSDTTVAQLWEQIGDEPCSSDRPLYVGGPVEGPLMSLHSHESLADQTILPGIFFSVQKENLTEVVSKPDDSYRLFIGHAGWGAGQLEAEMKEGSWLILPATAEVIFYEGDDLWDKVRAEIPARRDSLISRLGIKHAPSNPRWN